MKQRKAIIKTISDSYISYIKNADIQAEEREIDYPIVPHFHDYIEIDLVIEGNGYHVINGKETVYERGVIVISRYSDYHYIKPYGAVKLLNVSFVKEVIAEQLLEELDVASSKICLKLCEEDIGIIDYLIRIIIDENKKENTNTRYVSHIIESIIIKILGQTEFENAQSKSFPIQQALSYLRAHFSEDPTVECVAGHIHYHPKAFSARFRKEMKLTYSQYLLKLKIRYAKTLLSHTDYSMERISIMCGFGSTVTFRHAFKNAVGVTPFGYRKDLLNPSKKDPK